MTPTQTRTFTASPSATPEPFFRASFRIFNSAGEEVATVAGNLGLYRRPEGLQPVQAMALPDQGSPAVFSLGPGLPQLAWDGRNHAGQPAASGAYVAVLTLTDAFGARETFAGNAGVLRSAGEATLEIFNSAGERVRTLRPGPMGSGWGMRLDKKAITAGQESLQINLGLSSPLSWDGTGEDGQLLASGNYVVMLKREGEARELQSIPVTLLAAGQPPLILQAGPNPLGEGRTLRVRLPGASGRVAIRLYNLAGELVGETQGPASGFDWPLPGLAPGTYLLRPRLVPAQDRQPLKPIKLFLLK